jgi:hypothetical protein
MRTYASSIPIEQGFVMDTIQKLGTALAIISIAAGASFANAQDTNSTSTATNGASTPDSTSNTSTNSRWGSPPVDRAARPSDPIPKATTMSERAKRFAAEEREWQRLSTS